MHHMKLGNNNTFCHAFMSRTPTLSTQNCLWDLLHKPTPMGSPGNSLIIFTGGQGHGQGRWLTVLLEVTQGPLPSGGERRHSTSQVRLLSITWTETFPHLVQLLTEIPGNTNGICTRPTWEGFELTTQGQSLCFLGRGLLNDAKGPQIRKMTCSTRKYLTLMRAMSKFLTQPD